MPRVALGAGIVGVAVRLQALLSGRSLWLDEAMLATNITGRGYRGLLHPLDNAQGAPVLFLWVERTAVLVLGNNEWALRVLPFAAGLAVLPLTYVVGCRLGGTRVGSVALILVSLSPSLVRYSTEVKQYSSDAAVTLALIALALGALAGSRRELLTLVVAGAIAPWLSHPALFTLAAVGVVLLVERRDRFVIGAGVVWLTSVAVEYVVSLRRLGRNRALLDYWHHGFPAHASSALSWAAGAAVRFVGDPAALRFSALVLAASVIGALVLPRRRALVVLPFVFLLLAAAAHKFPFQGRVVLFLVPLLLVLVAAVARRTVGLAVVVAIGVAPVATTLHRVIDPLPYPAGREVLTWVRHHRQPGDEVWLVDAATPTWRYYDTRLGVPAQRELDWRPGSTCSPVPAGHVWVVHIYTLGGRAGAAGDRIRRALDPVAHRLVMHRFTDASATRYDLAAPAAVVDGGRCLDAVRLAPTRPSGLRQGPLGSGRLS